MVTTLITTLGAALSLWNSKEKNKYIDELIALKEAYYAEFNKPESDRSDAVLDNLEFKLRLLAGAFSASVTEQNSKTIP